MNGCERSNYMNMIGLTSDKTVLDRADMELNIIDLFIFSISSSLETIKANIMPRLRDCVIDDL